MSAVQNEKPTDLDDFLDKFNIFGRYHGFVMLFVMLAFASNNLFCTNYIFAIPEVQYSIAIMLHVVVHVMRTAGTYSTFTPFIQYNDARNKDFWCANGDFANVSGCMVNISQQCSKWIYENPNSFVAEYDLACHEWKRTLVGTAHSFGYMLGLLLVGPLSDRLGRKRTIVITGVLGGVIGVTRSFSPWYWLYVSLEFLEAAIGDICSPMFVMMIELISTQKRVIFSVICSLGYAFGALINALVASQEYYWRTYLRVLYAPALLFFSYYFFLDESPRWLLSKGKKEEAIQILENAAVKNGIELDKNVLTNIHYEKEKRVNFGYLLKSTFTSKALALRFVVCVTWWTVCTFVNYGLTINSVSLPGNKYVNYATLALVDFPGHAIIMLVLLKFDRKLPLMVSFAFGGVVCIAQSFVNNDLPWLATTLFMAGKLASSLYFNITYIFTSELFPTYTRNSMHALCSSLGRIGSIIAPQTPLLMVYWSGLPAFLFGVASLMGAAATVLVPDTAHDALPDNVRQAEEIGMKSNAPIKTEQKM